MALFTQQGVRRDRATPETGLCDLDGNPGTQPDPNWLPLLVTPSFPEYVSGHSTFSGAAAVVLATVIGSNNVPFTVGSDELPGVVRSYTNLWATAEEIGMSRIYAGIHFPTSDLDGLSTGRAIANHVCAHYLLPLPIPARLSCTPTPSEPGFKLELTGTAEQAYVIQTSTNLVSWENLYTNSTTDGKLEYTNTVRVKDSVRFYRALEVY